jgi:hypothetical protein
MHFCIEVGGKLDVLFSFYEPSMQFHTRVLKIFLGEEFQTRAQKFILGCKFSYPSRLGESSSYKTCTYMHVGEHHEECFITSNFDHFCQFWLI